MITISVSTESKAIASLCDGSKPVQMAILQKLTEDHFGYPPCKELFKRVSFLVSKGKTIPLVNQFGEDVTLSSRARTLIQSVEVRPVPESKVQSLLDLLEMYKRLRVTRSALSEAVKVLKGKDGIDVSEVANKLIDRLQEVSSLDDDFCVSSQSNSRNLVRKILSGRPSFVETGFDAFDRENAGFPNGQVVITAANSGGGKSLFALNLAINQFALGYTPMIVSLEMDEEEVWQRICSHLSGIPLERLVRRELTEKQKEKVEKELRNFRRVGREKNCDLQIVCPTADLRMSDLIRMISYRSPDIVYVDYIGLLRPEDHRVPKHEQLGEIARLAKKFAAKKKIPVVLLAQLSDEEKVKYSAGITETSGLTLQWTYGDVERTSGEIVMKITKARNQSMFEFKVKADFRVMRIADMPLDSPLGL